MKRTLALVFMVFISCSAMAQKQQKSNLSEDKASYLEKSRKNKTLGWVLLGAGAAMTIGGAIGVNDNGVLSSSSDAYYVLSTVGFLSMLGSIPAFIISSNQANKAARLTLHFKNETLDPIVLKAMNKRISIPSVGIRYSF